MQRLEDRDSLLVDACVLGHVRLCDPMNCGPPSSSVSMGLFRQEYSYPDLVSHSKTPLRFDFAVLDDEGEVDFLIEFQGVQHYQPKSKFGGIAGLRT